MTTNRFEELKEKMNGTNASGREICSYRCLTDAEIVELIDLSDTWEFAPDEDGKTPYDYLNNRYDVLNETNCDNEEWLETAKKLVETIPEN